MRPGGFPVLWLMFFSSVVRCQGVNGPVVVYSRTVTDPPGYVAGMTVDGSGNAYLIGRIGSVFGGAFLTKVNATGKQWTVRLGSSGSDDATSVAVDPTGNVYVAGQTRSGDFPTLNAIQPRFGGGNCGSNGLPFACSDAFLVKLSPEGKITFSTFIGGTGEDVANGVAVDRDGYIYLTGRSGSDNFPVAASLQRSRRGKNDAFVMKLSASGNLVYSTYLGGSDEDWGQKLAVDDTGNAYVTGWTRSSDFPVPNAMQPALAGAADVFVAKLSPSGQLLYSTYLGGSADDQGRAIAVDRAGSVFLTGATESRDFPTRDPLQPVF